MNRRSEVKNGSQVSETTEAGEPARRIFGVPFSRKLRNVALIGNPDSDPEEPSIESLQQKFAEFKARLRSKKKTPERDPRGLCGGDWGRSMKNVVVNKSPSPPV